MRWRRSQEYDERMVTKFALFPIQIGSEVRWLEKVTVRQVYREGTLLMEWRNYEFLN